MVQPERLRADPLEAFLGRTSVIDTYTREEEDAFDYVCRHTLLRPRDLMTIGERLAALRPDERRNEYRLKEAVNQAATEIAHEYLAEIAPYVADLDPDRLFAAPARARPRRATRSRPVRAHSDDAASTAAIAFCALYRVGLLGYVQHDRVRGEWRAALPAPRRGDARARRRAAARDALPRASGPVRRDRAAQSRVPAADRPGQHRRLRPAVARDEPASSARARRAPVLACSRPTSSGFASLMRAGADAPGAQPRSRRRCGGGRRSRRSPRSAPATRVDRRRRSGRARADGAPPDGRRSTRRPASRGCASRCTTARCRRARATPVLPTVIVGRRRDPVRGTRRAARRAGPDLGDGGVSPAVPRAAVALAHDAAHRPGRRRALQREEEGLARSPTPGSGFIGSSRDAARLLPLRSARQRSSRKAPP